MDDKKRLHRVLLIATIFVAYFLLGAQTVQKELIFQPSWARSTVGDVVKKKKTDAASATALPFRLGSRFGFFTDSGDILYDDIVSYNVALSPAAWSNYPAVPDSVNFNAPDGSKLFSLTSPGYPYILNDRLFMIDPDRGGSAEYDRSGTKKWSRQYSSVITSMDATAGLTLTGLLDGRMVLVDSSGRSVFEFSPGGSGIPVILGCALSPNGEYIALVCGIDKERFVLLQRKPDSYKVVFHDYLSSDFRRQVKVIFLQNSRKVVFEQEGKLGILDIRRRRLEDIPFSGRLFSIESGSYKDFFVVLSESGTKKRLVGLTNPNSILLDRYFDSDTSFIYQAGRSLFVGKDAWIMRIDIVEG
jgi:hypothetical protein